MVAEWNEEHPRWPELVEVIETLHQGNWVSFSAGFHRSSHLLVALQGEAIAGFLRFVVQEIGPDDDLPSVEVDGIPLLEAKVLAFGVLEAFRGQGIGRALQDGAIRRAEELGCYQIRSHSSGSHAANHRLKLAMGFGIHPIRRDEDKRGAYFILPLKRGFPKSG
jgi:GNAT superfamily N-acetyltransferase